LRLGNGFSDDPNDIVVLIGGVACEVQTSSLTFIQCTVGNSPAGVQQVQISVQPSGKELEFKSILLILFDFIPE